MPTADYRLEDGTRVPGTTTIINRFKASGGLIHWAWSLGMDGKDYREVRDKAGEAGSICHEWIDRYIKQGVAPRTAEALAAGDAGKKAFGGFEAFLEWWKPLAPEITDTECHLVSEKYRYGGTPDAYGTIGEKPALLDWKTSNAIYADYLLQLAAYCNLLHEVRGVKLNRVHLLRVGKENADFHHHSWTVESLFDAWTQFKLFRRAYDLDKTLKKMV